MVKITAKDIKKLQNGELEETAMVNELVANYPVGDIAAAYVALLKESGKKAVAASDTAKPAIKITAEQKEELLAGIGALIEVIKVRGPRKKKEE